MFDGDPIVTVRVSTNALHYMHDVALFHRL